MATLTISSCEMGMRFDRFLRQRLPQVSLGEIYRLIRQGHARVNGRKVRQNCRLVQGDRVEIDIDDSEVSMPQANGSSEVRRIVGTAFFRSHFRLLFEDRWVMVCDKPCGLVVHPGTGHRGAANLIDMVRGYLLSRGEEGEPDLVHRLDRDTSGAIIIAKNKSMVRLLHEQLRSGLIAKRYLAICHGRPQTTTGVIDANLRYTYGGFDGTKVRIAPQGLAARTRYTVTASFDSVSRVEIDLETGRTHQIRVHFSHIGCPLVGDSRYGNRRLDVALFGRRDLPRRLYLHAWQVLFLHPCTGRKVRVVAPEPVEFCAMVG